jgi:transposase-like protein
VYLLRFGHLTYTLARRKTDHHLKLEPGRVYLLAFRHFINLRSTCHTQHAERDSQTSTIAQQRVQLLGVIPLGVNDEGYREILGVEVFTSEDEASWTAFLRRLVERGLSGIKLVTSDAHPGLRKAIASVLPGASWNRCYIHYSRNVFSRVPRKAQGRTIAMLRSVTAQTGAKAAWEQYDPVADRLRDEHNSGTCWTRGARRCYPTHDSLRSIGGRSARTTPWRT